MIAILYIVVTATSSPIAYVITSSFTIVFIHVCLSLVTAVYLLVNQNVQVRTLSCNYYVQSCVIGLPLYATKATRNL